jgi:hypothetical protein
VLNAAHLSVSVIKISNVPDCVSSVRFPAPTVFSAAPKSFDLMKKMSTCTYNASIEVCYVVSPDVIHRFDTKSEKNTRCITASIGTSPAIFVDYLISAVSKFRSICTIVVPNAWSDVPWAAGSS